MKSNLKEDESVGAVYTRVILKDKKARNNIGCVSGNNFILL